MTSQKPSVWKITGMLFMAPVMGAVFCIFLPLIGIAMLCKYGVEKVMRTSKRVVTILLA